MYETVALPKCSNHIISFKLALFLQKCLKSIQNNAIF